MKILIDEELHYITWSYEVVEADDSPYTHKVTARIGVDGYAIEEHAYCSKKDNYNKKVGRTIATMRLFKTMGFNPHKAKKIEKLEKRALEEGKTEE